MLARLSNALSLSRFLSLSLSLLLFSLSLSLSLSHSHSPPDSSLLYQIVVSVLVIVWAARLAGFLLTRILLWGEDHRFDEQRNNIVRLALFWSIQGTPLSPSLFLFFLRFLLSLRLFSLSLSPSFSSFFSFSLPMLLMLLVSRIAVWVWTVSLQVTILNAKDSPTPLGWQSLSLYLSIYLF